MSIAAELLHQVCTKDNHVISIDLETSGYILSPAFPMPYAQSTIWDDKCTITIETSKNLGIRLSSVYMDVWGTTNDCTDDILVSWTENGKPKEQTHCGREPLDISLMASYAVLSFSFTKKWQSNMGFALQYSGKIFCPCIYLGKSNQRSITNKIMDYWG